MNIVAISGRITKELEVKELQSGSKVLTFNIAVDKFDKDKNKTADFFTIKAWGSNADFIKKYFDKGDPIEINGELRTETYEKDGQKRTNTFILLTKCGFCLKPKSTNDNPASVEDKGELMF